MAWFYNFNFDEDKLYGMPIADMSNVYYGKRNVRINKEDDTIPRSTNPYTCGQVYYKVDPFPGIVYKRCFWLEERDDKLADEIRRRYLEDRAKKKDGKSECEYCEDVAKDIFYGEINGAGVSVFINDSHELELYISENGEEMKKTALMRYCPFCGRRLRNE